MASGVTYQALKRLSWLPSRDAADNGSVIGGQEYDDIFFIGGSISGVSINDITTYLTAREVVTPGAITQLTNDTAIIVENNASGSTSVLLLPSTAKRSIYIKDGLGNAATHNITIVANGADTIDGQATLVLTYNYQSALLTPISTGWSILA